MCVCARGCAFADAGALAGSGTCVRVKVRVSVCLCVCVRASPLGRMCPGTGHIRPS